MDHEGSRTPDQILLEFLKKIGFTGDEELNETHKRVTEFLQSYQPKENGPNLSLVPTASTDPIIVKGLKFHSLCAHHLLPFFGEATIAILPDGAIPGLGDFPRTLSHFSNQPQIQERLSGQIADHIYSQLGAQAVVVSLSAKQMCMEMRGSKATGEILTVASRGSKDAIARLEVLMNNSTNTD